MTELTPLIGAAAGVPDRDLHLLEAVEGQVPHHRAQAAPQAGVGRRHPAEALPVQLQPDIFFNFWSNIFVLILKLLPGGGSWRAG